MNYYKILDLASNELSAMVIPTPSNDWTTGSWAKQDTHYEFSASSKTIPDLCKANEAFSIITPTVAQSVHSFYVDGKLLYTSSALDFSSAGNMNSIASVPCILLKNHSEVVWQVKATGQFYANINHYPMVVANPSWTLFWVQTLPAITAGILLIVCLISSFAFFKETKRKTYFLFIATSFSLGCFFFFALAGFFPIGGSSDIIHRVHDTFLWIGLACLWFLFAEQKLVVEWVPKFILIVTLISVSVIWTSHNLSQAQVGSIIAHIGNLAVITSVCFRFVKGLFKKKPNYYELTIFICCLTLALAGFNDLMQSIGILALPLFSIGILSIVFLAAAVVNRSLKTVLMEHQELRLAYARETAVADTVRMLAHDVRAPFVLLRNGLEILKVSSPTEFNENVQMIEREVDSAIIKTNILLSDVLSTTLAHTSPNLVSIKTNDLLEQSLWLVKQVFPSRAKEIEISKSVSINISCDQNKIARAISNIVINALEAMPSNGRIFISIEKVELQVVFTVRNTHSFIERRDLAKIFDLGFSKDKKGGTGLGLNIAKKFIEESHGTIICSSKLDSEWKNGMVEFKIFFSI